MLNAAINTHELVKELKHAGFSESQAEAHVYTMKFMLDSTMACLQEEFVTKHELNQEVGKLRYEINQVESSLSSKINLEVEKLRAEILKNKNSILLWNFSMFITQVSLLLGLLGKVTHLF